MITGRQIRAARGLLEWNVDDLARRTGLTRLTISKIEAETVQPQEKSLTSIMDVFDKHGVEFLPNEGLQIRKNEIRTFPGKAGYRQFLDHIYETMKDNGGRICQLTSDGKYLRYADDYALKHLERMTEVPNLNARVLTMQGDTYFPASYCTYRWLDKSCKSLVPFYIYNDYVVMSLHETAHRRELIAVRSKLLAERYVGQFEMFWKESEIPKERKQPSN